MKEQKRELSWRAIGFQALIFGVALFVIGLISAYAWRGDASIPALAVGAAAGGFAWLALVTLLRRPRRCRCSRLGPGHSSTRWRSRRDR